MADTDRDDDRWFWRRHYARDGDCTLRFSFGRPRSGCWCVGDFSSYYWRHPYRCPEKGVPSAWHRQQRRSERSHARDAIRKACNGRIDWDDLTINYRRPYYW